ncbi:MAG: glycosyltransferase [Microbacter sp.]
MLGSLNRGGTETLVRDVLRHRSSVAFNMIGIYRKEGQLSDDYRATLVPLFKLRPKHLLDLGYLWHLRRLIRSNQLTLLHAQQPLDALFARLASLGMPVKVVLTLHGYDTGFHCLDRFLLRLALRVSHFILCVSNTQHTYYQKRYALLPSKVHTLYNGISFDKLDQPKPSNIRQELHLPQDGLLLGSVGNFVSVRDQMTLCRFAKRLHEAKVDFRFLFVGAKSSTEPERFDACVRFCADNGLQSKVFFLGSRNDVPSILHQLDAFLYASDHDTFGIAVIEAMAAALPVFVNEWDVMKEMTDGGRYATLYQTAREEDLLNVFNDFIMHPEPYRQKAIEAAEWVRSKYSIQAHLKTLESLYVKCLKA